MRATVTFSERQSPQRFGAHGCVGDHVLLARVSSSERTQVSQIPGEGDMVAQLRRRAVYSG